MSAVTALRHVHEGEWCEPCVTHGYDIAAHCQCWAHQSLRASGLAEMTTVVVGVMDDNGWSLYDTAHGGATWVDRRRFAATLAARLANPEVPEP